MRPRGESISWPPQHDSSGRSAGRSRSARRCRSAPLGAVPARRTPASASLHQTRAPARVEDAGGIELRLERREHPRRGRRAIPRRRRACLDGCRSAAAPRRCRSAATCAEPGRALRASAGVAFDAKQPGAEPPRGRPTSSERARRTRRVRRPRRRTRRVSRPTEAPSRSPCQIASPCSRHRRDSASSRQQFVRPAGSGKVRARGGGLRVNRGRASRRTESGAWASRRARHQAARRQIERRRLELTAHAIANRASRRGGSRRRARRQWRDASAARGDSLKVALTNRGQRAAGAAEQLREVVAGDVLHDLTARIGSAGHRSVAIASR